MSPVASTLFREGSAEDEEQLRISDEKYRTLVEQAPDGIFIADLNGNYIDVNNSGCKMLGYTKEELLTLNIKDLIPAEDLAEHPIQFDELIDGKTIVTERRLKRKDGSLIPVEISAKVLSDKRLQGIVRDITKRKRAEIESCLLRTITLQVSGANDFRSAMDAAINSVCKATGWVYGEAWIPSKDGSRLNLSTAWYRLDALKKFRKESEHFKFPPGLGLPGRAWSSKKPEWREDASEDQGFLRADIAREAGLKAGVAIPVLTDEEVIAVMVFFRAERGREDERMISLISTIAAQLGTFFQRKKAEDELRKAYEELKELERVKGDIINNVSHELKTPLAIAKGMIELVLEEENRKEMSDFLMMGKNALAKQADIIENLITLSRFRTHDFKLDIEDLPLEPAIAFSRKIIEPKAHKKLIEIKTSVEGKLSVRGDYNALRNVFYQLLDNAVKFNKERGVISIKARRKGGHVEVAIADTGIGIPKDRMEMLFLPLSQIDSGTNRHYSGTGTGLAVVKELVDAMGGKVKAESWPGKGSRFSFTLQAIPQP